LRADLAPFGVDVLLAIAGFGILLAVGLVPRHVQSMLGALGLAYLTGSAVVPIALAALLVVGVPFTLLTFFVVVLACVGIGVFRSPARAAVPASAATRRQQRSWRSWPAEVWVAVAFVALFGAYSVVGMLSALEMPLSGWDAWSIWARKAQMLTVHDSLVSGFFTSSSYAFAHLDYPLQYPIWEALHFRAGAVFDTQALLSHVWLLLVAFAWAVAYLLREQVRPVVWAPVLLLVAAAPGIWQQLLSGYADVPMAMFACLGAISLSLWLSKGDMKLLALAAIMLAAGANMKNEGLVTAVAMLLVAGTIVLMRKRNDVRAFLVAACAVVIAILPWRIWVAAHGIEGDMPVSKGLQPGYLLDRIERVRPSIEAINGQLADQGRWLYLLPLAALVVAASLVSGIGRRVAAFYLGSFVLVWAAFVWSYWISPHDLSWHLSTSVDRVVSIPMFICVAAVLHLSGMLVGALGRSRRRAHSASPGSTASTGLVSVPKA
jgi:hypothetical protein